MFNIITEGNYTEVTIGTKTVTASYNYPLTVIDNQAREIYINVEGVTRFFSTTTSKHVNRALSRMVTALDSFIYDVIEFELETEQDITELYALKVLLEKALASTKDKRLECLRLMNDKGNKHFYTVYNEYELMAIMRGEKWQ